MKPKSNRFLTPSRLLGLVATTILVQLGASTDASASSGTWSATASTADWNTSGNWSATFPDAITDTATFSNPLSGTIGSVGNPITLSAGVALQNMVFTGTAGAFNIGAVGGVNTITLRGSGSGGTPSFGNSISIGANGTNAEVINTNLLFSAPSSTSIGYNFLNNSTTSTAKLTIAGNIDTRTATNRFTSLQLDGSNTGDNTISGVITSGAGTSSAGQGNILLNKTGTGRWILSGANLFSGAGITNVAQGINVNGGTLVAGNNGAFGTTATANNNQVNINSGGTVEIANGITLDNGVSLNLNTGGTVQGIGTAITNGRINVGTAANTSVTISAVGASDVYTVGNAGANDFTGGSSTSTVNIGGAGTVVFSSSSDYAGGISIGNGSTLKTNSDTALGAAATAKLTLVGSGRLSIGTTAVRNPTVVGLSSSSATSVIETGFTGTSTLTTNIASGVSNTYAGILRNGTGALALTKSGLGTLTLGGALSHTGATQVSAGTLNIDFTTNTGASNLNGLLTMGGTSGANQLTIIGKTATANTQTFSNFSMAVGASKITLTPGASGGTAGLTITNAITTPAGNSHGTLQFSTTGTTTLSGNLSLANFSSSAGPYATYGTDDYAATNASGVVIAANYITDPQATAGILNVTGGDMAHTGASGNVDPTGIRFADATGRTYTNSDASYFLGSILVASTSGTATFTGSGIRNNGSSSDANRDFNIIQNSTNAFTMAAPLNNNTTGRNMSFVKSGTGTVILTAANGYSNGTYINEGTVQVGDNTVGGGATGALGTGGVVNNAALIFNRSGTLAEANVISGTGTVAQSGGGATTLSGASSFTGNININAGTLATNLANNTTNPATSALGNMQNASRSINVNNGGTLRFDAGDTFGGAGSTILSTLVINAGGTVTNGAAQFQTLGAVVLNGGTLTGGGGSSNGQFQMYAFGGSVTVGGSVASTISSAVGTTAGGTAIDTIGYHLGTAAATGTTFNVADATSSSASDLNISGALIDRTGGLGAASLTKTGAGTLTIAGTSTYTGATVVSAGSLLVNGALGNTAVSVTAASGTATLGGSGSIGSGSASVNVGTNGILAPGNSPGTLTVNGSTALNPGSTYAYQYTGGATAADLINVNGVLTISSGAILTLEDLGAYTAGNKFTLFAYDSLTGGSQFSGLADDSSFSAQGGNWMINYNDAVAGLNGGIAYGNLGSGFVTITAVPEPASILLGSLGLLAILRRRRN